MSDEVWRLYDHGDTELGELIVTGADFPWLSARFRPAPAFAPLRSLFAEEVVLMDAMEEWEAAYDRIRAAVTLAAPDGRRVPEFLLHIDGDEAWWRWSDEPFDEE